MKALLILPIILAACFYGLPELMKSNEKKRKKTDSLDEKLDSDIDKAERESASHEGEVARLEKEKVEQLESLDREDPAAFHNKRKNKK